MLARFDPTPSMAPLNYTAPTMEVDGPKEVVSHLFPCAGPPLQRINVVRERGRGAQSYVVTFVQKLSVR